MSKLREYFGDSAYYFKLSPSLERINWVQKSFAELSPDWPVLPNPVPNIRNQIIIHELSQFSSSCYFLVLNNGNFIDDNHWEGQLIIDLYYDSVEIAFSPYGFQFNTKDTFFLLEQIKRIGGFVVYDYQLQRELDLSLDLDVVEESYNQFLAKYMSLKSNIS
jgi:hypothetical protein